MTLIANAADRLLGAFVSRVTAAATSCAPGCHRQTCGCYPDQHGNGAWYWYDKCVNAFNQPCTNPSGCWETGWVCRK
jgi:hypothetical protein